MFNNRQYLRIKFLTRHKYQENLAGSDTGWKVGGGGGSKGKFCTHNKRFLKNALLLCKKVGAMTPRCPFVGGPAQGRRDRGVWGVSHTPPQ